MRLAIYPAPVEMKFRGGVSKICDSSRIVFDEASRDNAVLLAKELSAGGLQLEMQPVEVGAPRSGDIRLHQEELDRKMYGGSDGTIGNSGSYVLSVSDEGIRIIGTDPEGQLFGVFSFLQLINPGDWSVPNVDIMDWPSMSFRGLRGHFPKNNSFEIENFHRMIRAMAFCRLNQLWIRDLYVRRFPASIRLEKHPELSDDDAISKTLARDLIQYAQKLNVFVMGSISSAADIAWSIYPELIEMAPGESPASIPIKNEKSRTEKYRFGARFNFCPSDEHTYLLLFDIIDELSPLFTSQIFDLGIDEVSQYENGSRWVADERCQGKNPARLFAEYTNRLADYVILKGKIPLVNSTPFIKEHGGAFHDIYRSVALIRKNIVINNWSEGFVRKQRRNSLLGSMFYSSDFSSTAYFASYRINTIIHMVQAGKQWNDRPELIEQIGTGKCFGAFITHYTYMTGEKVDPRVVDGMSYSGSHFWSPNKPVMGSDEDKALTLYGRRIIENILNGDSYFTGIQRAKTSSP